MDSHTPSRISSAAPRPRARPQSFGCAQHYPHAHSPVPTLDARSGPATALLPPRRRQFCTTSRMTLPPSALVIILPFRTHPQTHNQHISNYNPPGDPIHHFGSNSTARRPPQSCPGSRGTSPPRRSSFPVARTYDGAYHPPPHLALQPARIRHPVKRYNRLAVHISLCMGRVHLAEYPHKQPKTRQFDRLTGRGERVFSPCNGLPRRSPRTPGRPSAAPL